MSHYFAVVICLLLCACQSQPYRQQAITPIRNSTTITEMWSQNHRFFVGFPQYTHFSVCHDLSCHSVSQLSLNSAQWQQVKQLFSPLAETAEQEREQIRRALALLETIVGKQIGTRHDLAKNTLHSSRYGQMDCIDEATNSSVYIRLLEQDGLLHWHISAPRTNRTLIHGSAPHNTASIIDISTQQRFAVDSWYLANGKPPYIVPMTLWKAGWKPE